MDPVISVVIPVYNRPGLLREAALSVLAQSIELFELIIVDDGSDDGHTRQTAEEIASMPEFRRGDVSDSRNTVPRIKNIRIPHSGMPGLARNRGADAAQGEYIAFLDSDDLWKPEKLSLQLDYLQSRPDIPLVHTREVWLRDGNTVSQRKQRHLREGNIFPDALKKCIIGPSTVLMRTSVFRELGGFREDMEIAEDYELWLRLTARYRVGYIDRPLVIKRAGHGDQLSEKYGQIEVFRIQGLKNFIDTSFSAGSGGPSFGRSSPGCPGASCIGNACLSAACRELARKCEIYAAGCGKRGKLDEKLRYEKIAARYADFYEAAALQESTDSHASAESSAGNDPPPPACPD